MAFASRSPMQWRPSNLELDECLTGNEINKAIVTWTLTTEHGNLYFLVITRILGSILQIIAERPSPIVDIFKNQLRVAEVDDAGGRSLKMLEWM